MSNQRMWGRVAVVAIVACAAASGFGAGPDSLSGSGKPVSSWAYMHVLYFFNQCGSGVDNATPALANLGITGVTTVTGLPDFEFQLTAGGWDLVVIDNYNTPFSTSALDALVTYYDAGGGIIFFSWDSPTYSSHPLVSRMGVSVGLSYFTPAPIYSWLQTPLFTTPNAVPDMTIAVDRCSADGQYVDVTTATAYAGLSMAPAASQTAIAVSPEQRLVYNAFAPQLFSADEDTDGKVDMVELYENEITLVLNAIAQPRPSNPNPPLSATSVPTNTQLSWESSASYLAGTWLLDYTWTKSTTNWYLAADGTFTDGYVGGGTWYAVDDTFTLTYTYGGDAIYTGTISSPTLMSGTMASGLMSGTWAASRTAKKAAKGVDGLDAVRAAVDGAIEGSGILNGPVTVDASSAVGGDQKGGGAVITDPSLIASMAVAPKGPVTPASALNVAVYGVPADPAWLSDVQAKLLSTGAFVSVSTFNVGSFTPTLGEVQAFDAVLVFSDGNYFNATALGDVMAQYAAAGGGVVCSVFDTALNYAPATMQGLWVSGGYVLADRSGFTTSLATLGTIHEPGHMLMSGVTSFSGGSSSYRPLATSVYPDVRLIAEWSDGHPLVSAATVNGSRRVDLGFYPVSSDARGDFWVASTDGAKLMSNALVYVAGGTLYDVYLNASNPPTTLIRAGVPTMTCDPGSLSYQTWHYWKVIARTARGDVPGPTWYFLTRPTVTQALDSTGLTWTNTDPVPWFGQGNWSTDGDAAQSGAISDGSSTTIITEVTGPGTLSFFWKVSSEANHDYLYCSVDGVLLDKISGEVDWTQKLLSISAGTHSVKWKYGKDGSGAAGQDAGWVDRVVWIPSNVTLPDALDNTVLTWTNSSASPWLGQNLVKHDGVDAGRSGAIGNTGSTLISTDVTGPGTLTFWCKVSSEQGFDFLGWSIDGVLQEKISGEVDWAQKTLVIPSGTHTVRWKYWKDVSLSHGSDCGWVDQVVWNPPLPVAVDNEGLTWTNSSPSPWVGEGSLSHDGVDAGQSGPIADNEGTEISTQVSGPGTVSFWWKVSSEADHDYLRFSVDGVLQDRISGNIYFTRRAFNILGAGIHTLKWKYSKDASGSAEQDRAWVDQVAFTPFMSLAVALDNGSVTWSAPGNVWYGQSATTHDGVDAAQTIPLADNGSAELSTTVTGAGTISFWWKVSSEADHDYLRFSVDGTLQARISGDIYYHQRTFHLGAGTHTLKWKYSKDTTGVSGADAAWVDQVVWTPGP